MEVVRHIAIVGGEDDNPARFVTQIEPIKLDQDAEMAITSLYHGQVFNIHSGNNKVYFYVINDELPLESVRSYRGKTQNSHSAATFEHFPAPRMVIIPEGNYRFSITIIRAIAKLIQEELGLLRMKDAMQPSVDRNYKYINVNLTNICLMVEGIKDTPWALMGVYDDKFASESFTVEEIDFDCSYSPAFVYANIVENSYINGKLSRNLGVVPIRNTTEWSLYEPTHPNYVPINVKEFSKILIEIRDMEGQYIKLNPMFKTVMCLKLRAIKRA